ncbi:MAG: rRNA maturation RNase YbeY [Gammaproteobacteria bacterium]|nr:rRNA maturation RNase YbeY [Gammaproteobacteria bacterium]
MSRPPVPLAVEVRSSVRRDIPGVTRMVRWVRGAVGARGRGAEVAVRIVGVTEGRRLNLLWRGRDYATNVLSFPAPVGARGGQARRTLGDIVVCAPVVRREARQQHKRVDDHWAHLLVHGALHLLGHDHENDVDAERMERRERRVLAQFGIADPYRISSSVSEPR